MRVIPDFDVLSCDDEVSLSQTIDVGVIAHALLTGEQQWPEEKAGKPTEVELRLLVEAGREAETSFLQANLKLVKFASLRAARRTSVCEEDLFQEGYLGLVDALRRFNPERGVRFASYAIPWIRYRISEAVRTMSVVRRLRKDSESPLVRMVSWDPEVQSMGWVAAGADSDFSRTETVPLPWHRMMASLTPIAREVIELRYRGDVPMSHTAISAHLGITVGASRRAEAQGLRELRECVALLGLEASDLLQVA